MGYIIPMSYLRFDNLVLLGPLFLSRFPHGNVVSFTESNIFLLFHMKYTGWFPPHRLGAATPIGSGSSTRGNVSPHCGLHLDHSSCQILLVLMLLSYVVVAWHNCNKTCKIGHTIQHHGQGACAYTNPLCWLVSQLIGSWTPAPIRSERWVGIDRCLIHAGSCILCCGLFYVKNGLASN